MVGHGVPLPPRWFPGRDVAGTPPVGVPGWGVVPPPPPGPPPRQEGLNDANSPRVRDGPRGKPAKGCASPWPCSCSHPAGRGGRSMRFGGLQLGSLSLFLIKKKIFLFLETTGIKIALPRTTLRRGPSPGSSALRRHTKFKRSAALFRGTVDVQITKGYIYRSPGLDIEFVAYNYPLSGRFFPESLTSRGLGPLPLPLPDTDEGRTHHMSSMLSMLLGVVVRSPPYIAHSRHFRIRRTVRTNLPQRGRTDMGMGIRHTDRRTDGQTDRRT